VSPLTESRYFGKEPSARPKSPYGSSLSPPRSSFYDRFQVYKGATQVRGVVTKPPAMVTKTAGAKARSSPPPVSTGLDAGGGRGGSSLLSSPLLFREGDPEVPDGLDLAFSALLQRSQPLEALAKKTEYAPASSVSKEQVKAAEAAAEAARYNTGFVDTAEAAAEAARYDTGAGAYVVDFHDTDIKPDNKGQAQPRHAGGHYYRDPRDPHSAHVVDTCSSDLTGRAARHYVSNYGFDSDFRIKPSRADDGNFVDGSDFGVGSPLKALAPLPVSYTGALPAGEGEDTPVDPAGADSDGRPSSASFSYERERSEREDEDDHEQGRLRQGSTLLGSRYSGPRCSAPRLSAPRSR
jgi:hypothetical protein